MDIMHRFGAASGHKINVHKSLVAPIRCAQVNLDQVLQNFARESSIPSQLLGPATQPWASANEPPVADSRPSHWKTLGLARCKLFNIGGLKELVKSVLSSLPTYLLMAIKPPKKFYKDLGKLRQRILWAGTQQLHGGKCKVNWETLCHPLRFGGLGIANLEAFGRAL
jgi:hypothetical protein